MKRKQEMSWAHPTFIDYAEQNKDDEDREQKNETNNKWATPD